MKRIGIVASHVGKDNLVVYNLFVVVLSFLLSLLIFFISAFSILAGFALTSYATKGFMVVDPESELIRYVFMGLTGVIGVINLTAVLMNIKLKR